MSWGKKGASQGSWSGAVGYPYREVSFFPHLERVGYGTSAELGRKEKKEAGSWLGARTTIFTLGIALRQSLVGRNTNASSLSLMVA